MAAHQQSAHVQVGLLLTQVRGEFLRASVSDPASPAKAAKALSQAFELLNSCDFCYHCRSHEDAAGGCEGERGTVAGDDDNRKEERVDKVALRSAFLESSYLPFASLLLREVGPTWLPVWDSAPAVSPADGLTTQAANAATANTAATTSPARAVLDGGNPGRTIILKGDISSSTSSDATTPRGSSPRDLFEAFFRPPAVPPSLALLALCEGLGKQTPTSAITRQLPLTRQSLISGDGGGGEVGLGARATPAPDPRAVQQICQLLEPYLQEPSSAQQQPQMTPCAGCLRSATKSTASSAAAAAAAETCRVVAAAMERLAIYQGDGSGGGTSTPDTSTVESNYPSAAPLPVDEQQPQQSSDRMSLLTRAVMELAGCGLHSYGGVGCGGTRVVGGHDHAGDYRCDVVDTDHGPPPPFVGGGAAETLASALCLAPQRVANSLGPIAPLDISPAVFFPAVCGAVVRAILAIFSSKKKTAGASAPASVPAADAVTAAASDVWRDFTGRLLSAGRASDLADAWLGAMVAAEIGDGVGQDESVNNGAGPKAAAAAWEAWADGPGCVPEAHAWMMARLPASRRKPFTEALLHALWPRDSRHHHHHRRRQQLGQGQPSQPGGTSWPPGFQTAACRVLVGRPLLSAKRPPPRQGEEGDTDSGNQTGGTGAAVEALEGEILEPSVVSRRRKRQQRDGDGADNVDFDGFDAESAADVSVGLVERLLLQRPLPPPAAEAIADTLAWCDRRHQSFAAGPTREGEEAAAAAAAANFGAAGEGNHRRGGGGDGNGRLLVDALKRVAAVWAEPSFLSRSPPRQQEFYTRFLLAALRSGGLDGQVGGAIGDQDAIVLLIRGVGSHLDVPARETRLRGMRVGEAVAALGGQSLRFDELDGEREEKQRRSLETAGEKAEEGDCTTNGGVKEEKRGGEAAKTGASGNAKRRDQTEDGGSDKNILRGKEKKKKKAKKGSEGKVLNGGVAMLGTEKERRWRGESVPAAWGVGGGRGDGDDSDLDPDMLLPLGGAGSGSELDDDDDDVITEDIDDGHDSGEETGGDSNGSDSSTESSSSPFREEEGYGDNVLRGGGFRLDGAEDDDDDSLEAYDLWDDQDDLAKVAEPVYLDQLIELLRSRDQPDTIEKHEVALKFAEKLVRRTPPDLAHRAAELSRDLLYLEDAFDLEDFQRLRAGALVATTATAPESCALYLGSEVWSTGSTEGTKLEILDILVQAASELAGWTRPSGGAGDGPSGEHPSSSGGGYPSALMQEARRTTPQGSVRRQQQRRKLEPSLTGIAATAAAATAAAGSSKPDGGGVAMTAAATPQSGGTVGDSKSHRGGIVGGTTRRWGYRRGPREQLRRNLFGRLAPVFFYPLAQGMILRLRQSSTAAAPSSSDVARTIAKEGSAADPELVTPYALPSATPPPPALLHCLTCLVGLCGNCPATPALAADLLGLAWLLRGAAVESRELRRAVLVAVATGIERSQDGAASGAVQGQQGEFLRWLQACAQESDRGTRELAGAVLGHSSMFSFPSKAKCSCSCCVGAPLSFSCGIGPHNARIRRRLAVLHGGFVTYAIRSVLCVFKQTTRSGTQLQVFAAGSDTSSLIDEHALVEALPVERGVTARLRLHGCVPR
ncbi:unnamed protein product [Pylaiella littoralis]